MAPVPPLEPVVLLIAAIFGAFIGSFLNVCIHRLPRGESVVQPPSRCYACGTRVQWYDNIPLLSWLILRGRCRFCASPFSIRYPVGEVAVAVMSAAAVGWALTALPAAGEDHALALWAPAAVWPWALAAAATLVLVYFIWVASVIDYDHRIIPDELSLPMQAVGPALALLLPVAWLGDLVPTSLWEVAGYGGASRLDPWQGVIWVGGIAVALLLLILLGVRMAGFVYRRFPPPEQRWQEADLRAFRRCVYFFAGCVAVHLIIFVLLAIPAETAVRPSFWLQLQLQWGVALLGELIAWWALYGIGFVGTMVFRRNAMGFGDVKFLAPLGAVLGPAGVVIAFLAASVIGTLIGLPRRLLGTDHEIPFGPFLAAGCVVAALAGPELLALVLPSLAVSR